MHRPKVDIPAASFLFRHVLTQDDRSCGQTAQRILIRDPWPVAIIRLCFSFKGTNTTEPDIMLAYQSDEDRNRTGT